MMKCSIKVCGNGGLFAITGIYQNKVLGRYRAFVTNPEYAIALVLSDRTIVISPEYPEDFVQAIRSQFPNICIQSLGSKDGKRLRTDSAKDGRITEC
jgi:hypothetical protein